MSSQSKFTIAAAPGAYHVARRLRDGSLLSVMECPTREAAQEEIELLNLLEPLTDRSIYAGRRIPLGHMQAGAYERRPVRWFSDAEAA